MFGVSFDLGGMSLVALDEHGRRDAGEWIGGRKKQRAPRHQFFRLPHVRNDLFRRLFRACAHARERERRAHQLQELAAAFRIVEFGCLRGEFTVQELLKLRGVGILAEAAPVQASRRFHTHLWHVEQLVSCPTSAILYS